ncbi:hypothetical protein DFQ26_006583 [Actinomortierella ambigua]|nr:hypothetical protein DFQ26_006583 [Actinomortierella ambigua]
MPHNVLAERQASIRKYAHLIKYVDGMSIYDDNPLARPFRPRFPRLNPLIEEHCRSLVTIKATVCDASAWAACMKLIQVNMQLREVDLTCTLPGGSPMVEVPLHKALVGHDRLVSLTLGCQTTATALLQILQACPSLRLLCVNGFLSSRSSPLSSADESSVDDGQDVEGSEDGNDSSAQGENEEEEEEEEGEEKQEVDDSEEDQKEPLLLSYSPFPLQTLRIRKTCDDPAIIQVLQHCPSLISLALIITKRISDALYKALEGNELDLPHLVKVYVNGRDLGNDSVETFLKAFPRHQIRHAGLINPTPRALQALVECQHQSLEVLLVNNPQDLTSLAMAPERCAQLKEWVVMTPYLMDVRYLIDRPWVCQHLETLLLPVGISEPTNSTPRGPSEGGKEGSLTAEQVNELFFKQLGQLTRLRVLDLTRPEADTDDDDILSSELSPLMWYVASGLRHLGTLVHLEEVHLGLGIWELTEKDMQVMKECWPRLYGQGLQSIHMKMKARLCRYWVILNLRAKTTATATATASITTITTTTATTTSNLRKAEILVRAVCTMQLEFPQPTVPD